MFFMKLFRVLCAADILWTHRNATVRAKKGAINTLILIQNIFSLFHVILILTYTPVPKYAAIFYLRLSSTQALRAKARRACEITL